MQQDQSSARIMNPNKEKWPAFRGFEQHQALFKVHNMCEQNISTSATIHFLSILSLLAAAQLRIAHAICERLHVKALRKAAGRFPAWMFSQHSAPLYAWPPLDHIPNARLPRSGKESRRADMPLPQCSCRFRQTLLIVSFHSSPLTS